MPLYKGGIHMTKFKLYFRTLKNNPILIASAVVVLIISTSAFFFILNGKNNTIPIQDTVQEKQKTSSANESAAVEGTSGRVFVDISGCVKHPGVYEVSQSSRVFEVIEKAGGVTKDADTSSINQAEPVTDGQKINVPDKSIKTIQESTAGSEQQASDGKVSINTADSEELQKIPGIGPVTAEKIISYRENNGSFKSIDDIKNVSGIGEKTFEKMKSMIIL